jgi:hypothetical protein
MTEKIVIHGSSRTEHVTEHRPLGKRSPRSVLLDLGFRNVVSIEDIVQEPWVQETGTTAAAVLRRLDRGAAALAALVSDARDTPAERRATAKRRATFLRRKESEYAVVPLRAAQEAIDTIFSYQKISRERLSELNALRNEAYDDRLKSKKQLEDLSEQHRAAVQESSELTSKLLSMMTEKQALEDQIKHLQEQLSAWEELAPALGELRILARWLAVSPEAEELEPALEQELRVVLASFSETFKRTSATLKRLAKSPWDMMGFAAAAAGVATTIGAIYRTAAKAGSEPKAP